MRAPHRIALFFTVAGVAIAAAAAPAGCFFPNYTFDKHSAGGGGTGPGTGPSMTNSGGNPSSGTLNGGGGMTSSSSGVGGVPCGTDGRCVADIPNGWTGYFALYDGDPTADPGCPSDFPSTTTMPFLGQGAFSDGGDASCKCTCKAPSGEKCNYPSEVDVQPGSCSAAQCGYILPLPANWDGSCTGMEYVGGTTCANDATCMGTAACSVSVTLAAATVDESAGSCLPNAVKVQTMMPAAFSSLGRACGDPKPVSGSCNGGQTCLPAPPSPFLGGLCVMQTGDVMCPAIFTKKHIFYDTFMDDRDCSGQCACPNPPTGATCTATVKLYSDLQIGVCSNMVTTINSGSCANVNGNPNVAGRTGTKTPPMGGSCAGDASGTTLTGSADPVGPTTFCCIP